MPTLPIASSRVYVYGVLRECGTKSLRADDAEERQHRSSVIWCESSRGGRDIVWCSTRCPRESCGQQ